MEIMNTGMMRILEIVVPNGFSGGGTYIKAPAHVLDSAAYPNAAGDQTQDLHGVGEQCYAEGYC